MLFLDLKDFAIYYGNIDIEINNTLTLLLELCAKCFGNTEFSLFRQEHLY